MAAPSAITKPGSSVAELDQAWRARLDDARALVRAGRVNSVFMHGIYALEICLKAEICILLNLDHLPKAFEFHDLEALLVLSGRERNLSEPAASLVRLNWDEIQLVAQRLNDFRYLPEGSPLLPPRARSEADAISFLRRLDDPTSGVIPWLVTRP